MKIGTVIESVSGIKIKIETIGEFFITGREIGFNCSCKGTCICTDFRIVSPENIKKLNDSL